jgi:hypothetical protein
MAFKSGCRGRTCTTPVPATSRPRFGSVIAWDIEMQGLRFLVEPHVGF